MRSVALVFFGGGLGSVARYLFALCALRALGGGFTYGTIAINALGSFLIVVFVNLGSAGFIANDTRLALTTGLMGGFTTYSAFNYETIAFVQRGAWRLGVLNVVATVVLCLLAGAAGVWVSGSWPKTA